MDICKVFHQKLLSTAVWIPYSESHFDIIVITNSLPHVALYDTFTRIVFWTANHVS